MEQQNWKLNSQLIQFADAPTGKMTIERLEKFLDFADPAAMKLCVDTSFLDQAGVPFAKFVKENKKRIGVALSDELKMIATPLESIPAQPFAEFLQRLKELIREKEVELILIGMPRNMDGSYGPATEKVRQFMVVLKEAVVVPIKAWDERLTSVQANKIMIEGGVRREQRKGRVDKLAAAILLQSYLDSLAAGAN